MRDDRQKPDLRPHEKIIGGAPVLEFYPHPEAPVRMRAIITGFKGHDLQ